MSYVNPETARLRGINDVLMNGWCVDIYPDSSKTREKFLVFFGLADSARRMIRGGFLTEEDRGKLVALVRDGSAASRVTRRANALVLLDGGWSCQEVAAALLMDDDTIRGWHKLFEQRGIEGLTSFDMGGSAGFLSIPRFQSRARN